MMNIITCLVSFLSGLAGSMGLGGGTVLILYLTQLEQINQKTAQGINLLFFLPYAVYSVISYKKMGLIHSPTVKKLIFSSLTGALAGYMIIGRIQTDLLTKLFGAFLIILALREFFSKDEKNHRQQ